MPGVCTDMASVMTWTAVMTETEFCHGFLDRMMNTISYNDVALVVKNIAGENDHMKNIASYHV